ncbi:MAG: hypothetical protein H7X95_09330, partial [Deltaproteobacteria bacterium]|nr:hypothetical protein [Deltaproteobacteria bacterium]
MPACKYDGLKPVPLKDAAAYKQTLDFFVGEPFDSTSPRFPANQVNIRMQNSSLPTRGESTDSLSFWVLSSYEVARCIRGGMKADGTPDWNPEFCDRSGPVGEGRMRVGTEGEMVSSNFVLFNSCPNLSAAALGNCSGGTCPSQTLCSGRGSWIAFSQFGALPANLTEAFKVDNGGRIKASGFHIELCDSGTVDAQRDRIFPIPQPA